MVRKVLLLLLSAMLATSLFIILPGCGQGDVGKANTYIENGDFYAVKLPTEGKNLEAALKDFFATLIGPKPESVSKPGGPLDKYNSALFVSIWLAEHANVEYKRVLDLNASEEQKKYAGMMIKITDKTSAVMEFIKVWFGEALNVIITRNPTKIQAYLTGEEFTNGQNQIALMSDEIDKLAKEATEYRQGKSF